MRTGFGTLGLIAALLTLTSCGGDVGFGGDAVHTEFSGLERDGLPYVAEDDRFRPSARVCKRQGRRELAADRLETL